MENLINNIQKHHNEEEIRDLGMTKEVFNWREELEFTNEEIHFYTTLLSSNLIERTRSNCEDANYLFQQLQDLKDSNESHIETCIRFQNSLENMKECDDVQCDNQYLKEHLYLKEMFEKHFMEFRRIKASAFRYVKAGIDSYLLK
ncbi:hypothetical protein RM549_03370 [Salegentibacter sp. F188]|uniref:Uncharacterized protein n=1 Tax=Autumnicola patrickiae TaxID=3075591 RepID=A0ABU3DYL7_9FLAO|nr:hypothetical protein [Salegentibacter sp. F188]MDT0688806.1 hypothetical protein [Salegentibacter sp. F188]